MYPGLQSLNNRTSKSSSFEFSFLPKTFSVFSSETLLAPSFFCKKALYFPLSVSTTSQTLSNIEQYISDKLTLFDHRLKQKTHKNLNIG